MSDSIACPSCGQSSPIGKRFCGDCGAPFPAPCPACGASNLPGKHFCGDCGSALTAGATELSGSRAPRAVVPAAPAAPVAEAERRLVTILFADLVGSVSLADQLDPERAQEIISGVHHAIARAVDAYGGYVLKYLGDGLMALFGAPVAREDDAERAVLAALAMHRALDAANASAPPGTPALAMRIGITSGEVIAGMLTAGYDVSGDAANTSARLQAAAPVGGVLVGEETMRLARRRLRFGERQLLSLKGKAEPVAAYPVLGMRGRPAERWEMREILTPLVGRTVELARLAAAWQGVQTGQGAMLTLVGEAGVGKSRLLNEAVAAFLAAGTPRVLWGRCASYGAAGSLWLVADLLRELCGLDPVAPEAQVRTRLAATLDHLLGGHDAETRAMAKDVFGSVLGLPAGGSSVATAEAQVRRQVLVRSLILLAGGAARTPALLVLEDLHWLDTASAEVLTEVLREVPQMPLLVLATQRPGGELPWDGWAWPEKLELQPLNGGDARLLAGAVLGGIVPAPDLLEHLAERAGGNPFFLEELLRTLRESGELLQDGGQASLAPGAATRLPSTLAELLLARLDRLESQARQVAQMASVIGRSFAVRLLAGLAGQAEPELAGALATLQRAEIVFPHLSAELEYLFKHATIQEAAYSTLLLRRRQTLHAKVARLIAALYPGEDQAELIAYHFARSQEQAEAAQWLERAGDRAASIGANQAAIDHYAAAREQVVALGRGTTPDERVVLARLDERLGDVRLLTGAHAQSQEDFARARANQPGPVRQAELWQKEGDSWERRSAYDQAMAAYQAAEALATRAGIVLPAEVRATLAVSKGTVHWRMGEYALARREAEDALALLCEDLESGAAARATTLLGTLAREQGEYRQAETHYRRSLAIQERIGDQQGVAKVWTVLGVVAYDQGDYARCVEYQHRSLHIRERLGDQQGIANSLNNLGTIAWMQGHYDQAREYHQRSLAIKERLDDRRGMAVSWFNLANLAHDQGKIAEAEAYWRRSLAIREQIGEQTGIAECWYSLGNVAATRGNFGQAEECRRRNLQLMEKLGNQAGIADALTSLGGLASARGQFRLALTFCRRARRLARRLGNAEVEGHALLELAGAHLRLAAEHRGHMRPAAAFLHRVHTVIAAYGMAQMALQAQIIEVDLHIVRGSIIDARAAAETAMATAIALHQRREEALLHRLLGRCALAAGDAAAAVDHHQAAIRLFEEAGATVEAARTRLAQAEALTARAACEGTVALDNARALLAQAQAALAEHGAGVELVQAESLLAVWES